MDAPVPAWIECILSRWIPCGGTTSSRPVGRRQRRKRARRWKMMRAAVRLKRAGLRARHPDESEADIDRRVREWLLADD